jgi:hypothetical protein
MLYRVLLGSPPFPAAGEIPLREDMREGNFLPPALAAPGLEPATAALIQAALRPAKGGGPEAGKTLIAALLAAIRRQGEPPRYASYNRLLAEG